MVNKFEVMSKRRNSYKWENLKYNDTLSVDIADMDFSLSEDILLPIIERLKEGNFGYEHEGDEYYEALSLWYKRKHNIAIQRSWVITSPGVISGIKTAICAFSDENASIIVLAPTYHSYITSILSNNRKIVYCPMDYSDGEYTFNIKRFEQLIEHENVQIFIFCSPHNPTGKVFSKDDINGIFDICKKHQVLIIADEVYEDFVYDNVAYYSCLEYADKYERLIVAKSLCKTFNTAGIQVSNFIIVNKEVREVFNKEKQKRCYLANNSIGIAMTEALFNYGEQWHKDCFEYILENIRIFKTFMNKHFPEVVIAKSEALYMLWIDFSKLSLKCGDIYDFFLERMHIKVAKGENFGMDDKYKNFVRINFACPRWIIEEIIKRMYAEMK